MATGELSPLQLRVIDLFFELPESRGFLLAGGSALVLSGLTTRPTHDVDLFAADLDVGVAAASVALQREVAARGWTCQTVTETPTFHRLQLDDGEESLMVDLAVDAGPIMSTTQDRFPPSFAPAELGARKLLALFDRAAARDFADLRALLESFSFADLAELARSIDAGFDLTVLADTLDTVERFDDRELAEVDSDPDGLRQFASDLAGRIRNSPGPRI